MQPKKEAVNAIIARMHATHQINEYATLVYDFIDGCSKPDRNGYDDETIKTIVELLKQKGIDIFRAALERDQAARDDFDKYQPKADKQFAGITKDPQQVKKQLIAINAMIDKYPIGKIVAEAWNYLDGILPKPIENPVEAGEFMGESNTP